MSTWLAVFLGAGIGGALRHGVNLGAARVLGTGFPFSTLIVNIVGCFVMGVLVESFARFAWHGRGTPAPVAPTNKLIVSGFYRFVRNPMYVSVLVVLAGWAIGYQSGDLAWYAVAAAIVFHLRVILFEEPTLARLHGPQWEQYRGRVRRWL